MLLLRSSDLKLDASLLIMEVHWIAQEVVIQSEWQ